MSTPKDLMADLQAQLQSDPSRTAGITANYAFDISGDNGGSWWIEAKNGTGTVHEGTTENATLTVHLTDAVFVQLATGEIDGGEAFFNGLLTAEGDEGKAIFLGQIFGTT